jgi:hypothetical protein
MSAQVNPRFRRLEDPLSVEPRESFANHWNDDCAPFEWTATADEIIEKVKTITARMERLANAVEIGDVTRSAA